MNLQMPRTVEISRRTLFFVILFLLGLWLVFRITDILLMLFISIIITSAMTPFVDWLHSLRLPRWLAITVVYLAIWGIIGLLTALVIPALVEQSSRLISILPGTLNNIDFFKTHKNEISTELVTRLGGLPESLAKFIFAVFGNLFNVFTTLVLSFYLLLERQNIDKYIGIIFRHRDPKKIIGTVNLIETRLGYWVRGQLFLMFSVGLFTYIGLFALGVDIALPLAVLAGLLDIVPAVGPILSAVPAVLIALSISPLITVATISLYVLMHLFENHVLVPVVMKRAVGVNPLVCLLSLLIGFRLAGGSGAILAIPALIVVQIIASEIFNLNLSPGEE